MSQLTNRIGNDYIKHFETTEDGGFEIIYSAEDLYKNSE